MSAGPTDRTDPHRKRDLQLATWRRATRVMPGGTDSNFRAWGEDTIYVDRGKGATVWDMDGNEYVDLRMGYGPVILGHADDRVDDYVNERMRRGVSFSLTSEDEIRANELLQELTGWVEMSRLTVSGTEATMHAMRVARAFTGRNKIVKFEGQYHGVHDYALISVLPNNMADLGDAENPSRLAWGRGIPDAVAATVIPARYNNVAQLRRLLEILPRGGRGAGDKFRGTGLRPAVSLCIGCIPPLRYIRRRLGNCDGSDTGLRGELRDCLGIGVPDFIGIGPNDHLTSP